MQNLAKDEMKPEMIAIIPASEDRDNRIQWSLNSWRSKHIAQEIVYPDALALGSALSYIRSLPGLVSEKQIDSASTLLEEAAKGNGFVIQGGDCAESFDDVRADIVGLKRTLLRRQREILEACLGQPVVEIGRIAGQYAKPRSSLLEVLSDGSMVMPFKGHSINSTSPGLRDPDPRRLIVGYHLAATTLELLRIEDIGYQMSSGMLTSHEALNLHFEEASTKGAYNTSAEFLWIGERTRDIEGAHVEYMRGLKNPIGVKVGPTATATGLVELMDILNPGKRIGKITLITRLGANNVDKLLIGLIKAIKASGHQPLWMCDPCHGNTITTSGGTKTRYVEVLISEMKQTYAIHRQCGSFLGGLHLEQTGEDVTECLDAGLGGLVDDETSFPNYRSLCDPRLSSQQALRAVEEFADFVKGFNSTSDLYYSISIDQRLQEVEEAMKSSVASVMEIRGGLNLPMV